MQYEELTEIPMINGCSVIGDKTFEDYGLIPLSIEDVQEIMLEVYGYVL